ncbi:dynein beta chain, ciliary-like [Aedes albopictus]|uniref:Dynein heavy chain tail domain-containing protein n=1 Tax=Aedes albopictus TaxID=7160 RepID=A0ABM1YFF9_AEDAL
MDGGSGSSNSDPRFEFLGSFVQKTLKLKPEKWHRLVTFEEHKAVMKEFFDNPASLVLIIILTPSAQLIPIVSFPIQQLKNKGVYFVKKNAIEVPREGCKDCLVVGDLATRTIDQLSCLVDEIFVPLLSNSENHQGWPEMVAQDVQKQVHSLKSTVYQVQGQVSGQTVLPMPVGVDKCVQTAKELVVNAECSINLYLKSAIEGVVIKWATQVNDVMLESSANAFNGGQNPVPSAEINFWNNRLKNLTYIYEQLRHERIRSMALILEFTDSAYYPCFKTLFKNVVTALAEARDITLYLNPLTRHFQQLEDTEFSECKVLLKPLMHVVCLIWSNSLYYCHSAKLIVLLRQICNLIIQQVTINALPF